MSEIEINKAECTVIHIGDVRISPVGAEAVLVILVQVMVSKSREKRI